jgi:adenosylcobinamide-GDP ribazoletransferase
VSALSLTRRIWFDLLTAIQFLTRLPVPSVPYEEDSLARAVKYFPLVGLLIGLGGALVYISLAPHLPLLVVSVFVVLYSMVITGGLHEDGLADSADGFGGGRNREKILAIMRDSRIGSFGAIALTLSIIARVVLIASIRRDQVTLYLIAAPVLSRWTTLPLSYYLESARGREHDQPDGQGARIARLTTGNSFFIGSVLMLLITLPLLRGRAVAPILAGVGITFVTGLYFKRRIGGITGDCFGATNQFAEIAAYLCGVWS